MDILGSIKGLSKEKKPYRAYKEYYMPLFDRKAKSILRKIICHRGEFVILFQQFL